ncbi:MAG: TAXI family TRAP transporter solute-binding subunit [Nitrososphaerales archaeon]|nr:TAXI family TRAP transporter solute-binding subunit [Nitrososphaerales archaeon]
MKTDDFAKWERLGAAESASALRDGKIDAYFWSGGLPTGSVTDLAVSLRLKGDSIYLIPFVDEKALKYIDEKWPGLYYPTTIPKESYPGLTEDVKTTAIDNLFVCHADLSEDAAYRIVKAVFDNIKELHAVHTAALETTLEKAPTSKAIPYHPGAIKYYREKGVWK